MTRPIIPNICLGPSCSSAPSFDIDIKRFESCGDEAVKIIAYISELAVVTTILMHLGLPHTIQPGGSSRLPPDRGQQIEIDFDENDEPSAEERDFDSHAQNRTKAPPN